MTPPAYSGLSLILTRPPHGHVPETCSRHGHVDAIDTFRQSVDSGRPSVDCRSIVGNTSSVTLSGLSVDCRSNLPNRVRPQVNTAAATFPLQKAHCHQLIEVPARRAAGRELRGLDVKSRRHPFFRDMGRQGASQSVVDPTSKIRFRTGCICLPEARGRECR